MNMLILRAVSSLLIPGMHAILMFLKFAVGAE